MQNLFNSIQLTKPNRNFFDLSHDFKFSANFGELVPTCCIEAVPGDKFQIGCQSMVRMAPMVAPVMHRANVTTHYFFVPNRLVWPNWEEWVAEKNDHGFPTLEMKASTYGGVGGLANYLGIPVPPGGDLISTVVSALPFAAYQKIYNDWFRAQTLINEIDTELVDGNNTSNTELYLLRKRAWMHDYFTSALPTPQDGGAVDLPLGDVVLKDDTTGMKPIFRNADDHGVADTGLLENTGAAGGIQAQGFNDPMVYDPEGTLETAPTTVNEFRRAVRLQEFLERMIVGGKRYIEIIYSMFGVKSDDARLQRPEYITGTVDPIIISEVLNTTGTTEQPQGDMAGHGISVGHGKYGSYFVKEHGFIIGIQSVMPTTAYFQGLPKHFIKTADRYQYFWPKFANIGEQAILNKELFTYTVADEGTFGYTPRYAEYKYMPSRCAGDFQTSLLHWHMARKFDDLPLLNKEFVEMENAEVDRIFAVQDDGVQKLWCHVQHIIKASRLMPKFGTPTI